MTQRFYIAIGTIIVVTLLAMAEFVAGETAPAIEFSEAKQIADPTPSNGMTESLDIDLQNDPRSVLETRGRVNWKSGWLMLGADGVISRTLDLGAKAKLSFRLAFPPLEDGQTATSRFALHIRDRGDFVVELARRRDGGKAFSEVRLIDRDAPRGREKQTRTLCTTTWKGDFPDSPWIFRLHHGLLTVYCGDKFIIAGHSAKEPIRKWKWYGLAPPADEAFFQRCGISEPLEISGWSMEQAGASVDCSAVSGHASPSYRQGLSPDWQLRLASKQVGLHPVDQDENLRLRINQRVSPGDTYQDSLQKQFAVWEKGEPELIRDDITGRSLTGVAELFGKRHHYYALALAGVGVQFSLVGYRDDVAERLLKQAAEIAEEDLGIWHPDCAMLITALARFYINLGKNELAEPLLKKVSAAIAEAFRTDSFDYAKSRRELAVLDQYKGRLAEAETSLRQAVDGCQDATLVQRADLLISLGELQAVMGERKKADAVLQQAAEALTNEIQRLNSSHEDDVPLYLPFARAKAQLAWLHFHDGQKDMARQSGREVFLSLVQFTNRGGMGRFGGWNRDISNAMPNFLILEPDPVCYGIVMLNVAELFIALGDVIPATGALRILDQVPGQTHHQRGAIYRLMGKICAADPNVSVGIRPSFSERMRLDSLYSQRLKLLREAKTKEERARLVVELHLDESDRVTYWQKHAQDEFERFAGREHVDTIGMLQDRAHRQWQVSEPTTAELTLNEAFSRAILQSSRVLNGLPEAQAYQFCEASPPPTDLLLSCIQATRQERGREAYNVVWQAKALATRQLAERREVVRATNGPPEVAKLANELRTASQQLAELSLSPPAVSFPEQRQRQLATLTQRKEDLERELAKTSEPFRLTRDAGRISVAEMIRLLPEKTAIVEFVERTNWIPPANSGVLGEGSIWEGRERRDESDQQIPVMLKITNRDGSLFKGELTHFRLVPSDEFKGRFTRQEDSVNEVEGSVSEGKVEWHSVKLLRGNPVGSTKITGTLKDNTIEAALRSVKDDRQSDVRSGVITLTVTVNAALMKRPAVSAVLPVGSIWKGEKLVDKSHQSKPAMLKITKRDGDRFHGELTLQPDKGDDTINLVEGRVFEGKFEWRTTKVLQGNINPPTTGTVTENSIDATFKTVPRGDRQAVPAAGTIKLTRESDPSIIGKSISGKSADKAIETDEPSKLTRSLDSWSQTRCYDAFVLQPVAGEPGWSAKWLTLGDADAIDHLLEGWITSVRSKRQVDTGLAGRLRHRLWEPLESSLKDCERVILIPDGRLANTPWSALPGRLSGSYLLEDYELVEAPYGQYVARLLTDPAPTGDGFLAVGGIDYGQGGKWNYLQGTADEAEQLKALRPDAGTVGLSGEAANKPHLMELLAGRRYVHLATHGEFIDPGPVRSNGGFQVADGVANRALFDVSARNPMLLSMLVLAGANRPLKTDDPALPMTGDSFLTAEEVMGIDLTRTELVVLSACETALGKVRGGEGVFSLERAFHIGGCRSVVASLWQIPDKATQVLMQKFYENLWNRKLPKLKALREAQIWMLHQGRKEPDIVRGLKISDSDDTSNEIESTLPPFFWAAFRLSGDWR